MLLANHRLKNSYLHKIFSNQIDPRYINQKITDAKDLARQIKESDSQKTISYKNESFNLPTSLSPMCFAPNVDATKTRIAYYRLGIPRLIHQLNSTPHDILIISQALTSLNDELQYPQKCIRAIHNYHIVKRLTDLLQTLSTSEEYCLDRICLNLQLIAHYYDGAVKIIAEDRLINNLYDLIKTTDAISQQVAKTLAVLSNHLKVAEIMISNGHLQRIYQILQHTDNLIDIYNVLSNLIERNPAKAFELDFFEFLLPKICKTSNCQTSIMKCFALLIQCKIGQKKCDENDVIKILYDLIENYEMITVDTLANTVLALQNCTFSTRSRLRAKEFPNLCLYLIKHANNKSNKYLQLYCLQALRQITEMHEIKESIRKIGKYKIKKIYCPIGQEQYKYKLLNWLRHRNYKCVNRNSTDPSNGNQLKLKSNGYDEYGGPPRGIYRVDKIPDSRNTIKFFPIYLL